MKNPFQFTLIVAFVFTLFVPQLSYGQVKIGDMHEGGIVFFLWETTPEFPVQHGLICTPQDLGAETSWTNAVKRCEDHTGGGYTDWFLPNKDDLTWMYQNLHKKAKGGFANYYYWSSSANLIKESAGGRSWTQNFKDGRRNFGDMGFYAHVRAMRTF